MPSGLRGVGGLEGALEGWRVARGIWEHGGDKQSV